MSYNTPVRHSVILSLCVIVCLLVLQKASLVFASSSTVYGHHSPLPFSTKSTSFAPSSIYASTKISNEHFADVFCSQYGLRAVGVRFFTVYGPWGRPDMAVYKFSQSLYEGRAVMFHNSTAPVGRDFTYISDVVRGVLQALEHRPSRCGEVYNIGYGRTVPLTQLLKLLERELNKTAKIVSERVSGECGFPHHQYLELAI